jgi:hypothetical protein
MQYITVEPHMGEQLSEATGQAVLCDAEGRVIGIFSPLKGRPRLDELNLEPLLTIEETEALRLKNRTGKPLEEILARLGF